MCGSERKSIYIIYISHIIEINFEILIFMAKKSIAKGMRTRLYFDFKFIRMLVSESSISNLTKFNDIVLD